MVTNPLTVQQVMNHGSRVLVKYEVVVVLVDVVTIVEKVYLAEIILVQVVDEVEIITTVLLGEMVELVQVDILDVVVRQQFLITTLVNLVLAVAVDQVLVDLEEQILVLEQLVKVMLVELPIPPLSLTLEVEVVVKVLLEETPLVVLVEMVVLE